MSRPTARGTSSEGRSETETEACETLRVSLICERSSQTTQAVGEDEARSRCCAVAVTPRLKAVASFSIPSPSISGRTKLATADAYEKPQPHSTAASNLPSRLRFRPSACDVCEPRSQISGSPPASRKPRPPSEQALTSLRSLHSRRHRRTNRVLRAVANRRFATSRKSSIFEDLGRVHSRRPRARCSRAPTADARKSQRGSPAKRPSDSSQSTNRNRSIERRSDHENGG